MQYAQWEESQKDYRRARSVWERALDVSYASVTLWLKYAEMEMRARFINHARNVWDRAVTLLPRIDQLWYKYIHMEEMLNNVPGARQIFERWMQWEPDHHGWAAYIKVSIQCLHNTLNFQSFQQQHQGLLFAWPHEPVCHAFSSCCMCHTVCKQGTALVPNQCGARLSGVRVLCADGVALQ